MQELGIESYLPLVKQVKQWSDRKKTVEEPLFTGYLFVKLLPSELDKPRYVNGVVNYLSFEKRKAIVTETEIDNLKHLVDNGYALNQDIDCIKIGSKVKLLLSSFKNEVAFVEELNNDFAVIFFESLNQYIKVKAPIKALEIAK